MFGHVSIRTGSDLGTDRKSGFVPLALHDAAEASHSRSVQEIVMRLKESFYVVQVRTVKKFCMRTETYF